MGPASKANTTLRMLDLRFNKIGHEGGAAIAALLHGARRCF
jgi:hypothetical protein